MKNVQVGGGRSTFFCSFGLPMACFAQMDHEWNFSFPPSPLVFNLGKSGFFGGEGDFSIENWRFLKHAISGNKKNLTRLVFRGKKYILLHGEPVNSTFSNSVKKGFFCSLEKLSWLRCGRRG